MNNSPQTAAAANYSQEEKAEIIEQSDNIKGALIFNYPLALCYLGLQAGLFATPYLADPAFAGAFHILAFGFAPLTLFKAFTLYREVREWAQEEHSELHLLAAQFRAEPAIVKVPGATASETTRPGR